MDARRCRRTARRAASPAAGRQSPSVSGFAGRVYGGDAFGIVDEQEHVACPLPGLPPCQDHGKGGAMSVSTAVRRASRPATKACPGCRNEPCATGGAEVSVLGAGSGSVSPPTNAGSRTRPGAEGRWALSAALNATHPDSLAYARSVMVRESRQAGRLVRLLRKPDGMVCLDPARNAPMRNALSGVPTLAAGNALVVNVPPTVPLRGRYESE